MRIETPELKHAEFLHLVRDVVLLDLETLRETTEDARELIRWQTFRFGYFQE